MNVAVLMDNTPNGDTDYHHEHGLSIHFEADGLKWLMDCGSSKNFYLNALKMGIRIEEVDFLVLSHAHTDHTGGLEQFLRVNQKAKIILSATILGRQYVSHRFDSIRNIGINHAIVAQQLNRYLFINNNRALSPNVAVLCQIPKVYPTPKANKTLYQADAKGETLDDFTHEIILAVNSARGVVVFSGCSHNGVLNVLETASQYYNNQDIRACIGGTHLVEKHLDESFESDLEIETIGQTILARYPNIKLITGHCTGATAFRQLKKSLQDQIIPFYSGATFTL